MLTAYLGRVSLRPSPRSAGQQLINGSRQTWGQYKADIRIRYEDMDRVEVGYNRYYLELLPRTHHNSLGEMARR